MIDDIYIFSNYNMYASKRHFTYHFAKALQRQGIATTVIDMEEASQSTNIIGELCMARPTLTCSFNSLPPLQLDSPKYLWDCTGIPHWSILVDSAIYNMDLIESPLSILSCVDRGECSILRQYGGDKVFFWPHAVEASLALQGGEEERHYDIAFTGSCYDHKSLRAYWLMHLPKSYSDILEAAVSQAVACSAIPLPEVLVGVLQASKVPISSANARSLFQFFDYYIRSLDRVQLIRAIAEHHTVHVFGSPFRAHGSQVLGWHNYLADCPKAIIHAPVNFEAALEIMKRSKIYLNSMPSFKDGSHERIFTALACGAVPVTSDSIWLREEFIEGEELLIYKADGLAMACERITALLADEEQRRAIAERGRQKVVRRHTWDQRVTTLLQEIPPLLADH